MTLTDDFDRVADEVATSQLVIATHVPPFVPPRWESKRSDLPTHGHLDVKVAELLGWELFEWQVRASMLAGEYDPVTMRPRFRTVGASVARQNGKTSWILTRIARQLLPAKQHVAYTAQDRSLAVTKWREHVEILMDTPFASRVEDLNVQRNSERLLMKNGSWYIPVTPTAKKAARSLSMDLVIVDEAYAHTSMGVAGAIRNTLLTRPLAQMYITSNAGDETSALWRHYTDLGRASVDDPMATICWIEYASSEDASRFDPLEIRAANPSAGEDGGVDWVSLLTECREGTDEVTVRRENMNLWTNSSGVGLAKWWAGAKRNITVADVVAAGGRIVLGLDFEPERDGGALMACAILDDEGEQRVCPIEVIAVANDPVSMEGLVKRAADNAIAMQSWVAVGASSPAASAIPDLEKLTQRQVKGKNGKRETKSLVFPVTAQGTSRAVGAFHDAVVSAKIAHRDDPVLNAAVVAVIRREVGDAFVWERRDPTGESKPSLVTAATMAHWGALTAGPVPPVVAAKVTARAARRHR